MSLFIISILYFLICSNSDYKRSVNLVTLTNKQELEKYRRQFLYESASLIIIIIAIIFTTITPFLLIPIWVVPNQYSPLIRNLFWMSLSLSVVFLTLGAMIGNIYWYFEEKSQKWKWFYHCGKGPIDHYWGSTIFHSAKPSSKAANKQLNSSINVWTAVLMFQCLGDEWPHVDYNFSKYCIGKYSLLDMIHNNVIACNLCSCKWYPLLVSYSFFTNTCANSIYRGLMMDLYTHIYP